jgi:hypothetical protein
MGQGLVYLDLPLARHMKANAVIYLFAWIVN